MTTESLVQNRTLDISSQSRQHVHEYKCYNGRIALTLYVYSTGHLLLHCFAVQPEFYLGFNIRECKQVPGGPSLSLPLPLPSLPPSHLLP